MQKNSILLFFMLSLIACSTTQQLTMNETKRNANKHEEKDGMLVVEAEHYQSQTLTDIRQWYVLSAEKNPSLTPDPDPNHHQTASGGAYLEILPDTRTNHDEKLITGENFSNEPGKLAALHYPVFFNETGKYYVWVRAHSTGSEDNGIHVGLDGQWPESGQRMQWCDGKHQWSWASKQRTKEVHCGEPELIYLDIKKAGWHTISFSMREDGFEFDKWIMTKVYEMPEGGGGSSSKYFTKR